MQQFIETLAALGLTIQFFPRQEGDLMAMVADIRNAEGTLFEVIVDMGLSDRDQLAMLHRAVNEVNA